MDLSATGDDFVVTINVLSQPRRLQSLDDFYAEDERRRTHGHHQFGFNWKDPEVTDWNCYCEVHWYYGTHEIAAVYQTVDPAKLVHAVSQGSAAKGVLDGLAQSYLRAEPAGGPAWSDTLTAVSIGSSLARRDIATTKTEVRLMGVLEHPLERWWVLRDAFELELKPDGLQTLQRRIDECAQGERVAVEDHSFHTLFQRACGLGSPDDTPAPSTEDAWSPPPVEQADGWVVEQPRGGGAHL